MHKILAAAALAAVSLSSVPLVAQAGNLPTQAEVAAKQKETIEALNKVPITNKAVQAQTHSNAVAAGAAAEASSKPQVSQATKEDFTNLVRTDPRTKPADAPAKPTQADLMIFVSLSMPDQMLEQYAVQAKRFGAVLMMRGFVNDKLSDTKAALSRLNRSGAQWEISPEPFTLFKIDKVPAVVIATADSASILEDGCAKPENFTAVFGDMSVLAALDKISLRGQKSLSDIAKARIMADRQAGKKE